MRNYLQLKKEAEQVANFILQKNDFEDHSKMLDLREMICELNFGEINPGSDNWELYQKFIEEISYALSNPKISAKLSEDVQEDAFKMLRQLSRFFRMLAEDSWLQTVLLCHSLKHTEGNLTDRVLAEIKEEYCEGVNNFVQ